MGDADAIMPFRIDVPEEVLTDLRDRLRRTRWPDQIPGTEWVYGTDLTTLQDLCAYWASRVIISCSHSESWAAGPGRYPFRKMPNSMCPPRTRSRRSNSNS